MEAVFGEHLFADIIHDFPSFKGPFYNIGGDLGKGGYYSENTTSERLLEKQTGDPTFAARLMQKIVFTVPKKTSTFQKTEAPQLFAAGNQYVGIVQDAGEYITDFLGAKNVITFGSILDPASKPIAPEKNAIWYDIGPVANLEIPLAEFGFDPKSIESINIGGLRGGGIVSAIFKIGGSLMDAVKMQPFNPASPGVKPINNTKIEVSGYFTSIEGANLRTVAKPSATDLVRFNIGKTLGDVMLVASIMPSFNGGTIPNQFLTTGGGTWKSFNPPETAVEPPQILVLKTGDILNHTRAILKNVPSILERQAGAGRVVKQYEFVPATANPDAIYASFTAGYNKLVNDVTSTYQRLIDSFTECVSGGTLIPGRSNFSGTGDVVKTPAGSTRAALIINQITGSLEKLRDRVVIYYTEREKTALSLGPSENNRIRDLYEIDVSSFKYFVPQTLEVFDTRKNVMKTKIVVAQVPRKGLEGLSEVPLPVGSIIEIAMWNTFTKLDESKSTNINELGNEIVNTDLNKKFFTKIPKPAPAPAPVAMTQAMSAETASEIKDIVAGVDVQIGSLKTFIETPANRDAPAPIVSIETIVGPLGATDEDPSEINDKDRGNVVGGSIYGGGIPRKITLHKEFGAELYGMWKTLYHYESIPETLYLFLRYLYNFEHDDGTYFKPKSPLIAFGCAIDVCELGLTSPNYGLILDVDLLESMILDLKAIAPKFKIDPAPKTWGQVSLPTLASIYLFNAFTCFVNAENALIFQSPDDKLIEIEADNELWKYYDTLENEFRSKAAGYLRLTRVRKGSGNSKTRKLKLRNKARKTNRQETYV